MKNFIVSIMLIMLITNTGWSQDTYLNKKFVIISSHYIDRSCDRCVEISEILYDRMKDDQIFNFHDESTNWRYYALIKKDLTEAYRGFDFFLTSEVIQKSQNYVIEFTLYDSKIKRQSSGNFKHTITLDNYHGDMVDVANIIIQEINDFKSNGHFKEFMLVDNFNVTESYDDLEDFSNWLAIELKNHKAISDEYHIFSPEEVHQIIKNKLNGKFFKKKDTSIKMKMKILKGGKQFSCETLTIDIYEYTDLNKKEILNEITNVIKKFDKGS